MPAKSKAAMADTAAVRVADSSHKVEGFVAEIGIFRNECP
jgi:hypothetical protein